MKILSVNEEQILYVDGEMVVAGMPHPDYDTLLDEDVLREELEAL